MNEKLKKRAEKKAALVTDYKKTFRTEHANRVLCDLIHEHFVMGSTYSPDAHRMAFNEGQRQVILRIMAVLEMDPNEVLRKIKESSKNVQSID